jgi:hypothetical protein
MSDTTTLDGWTVMLMRGEDGVMLVQIDSPPGASAHYDAEHDAEGWPRARIYLNDGDEPLYERPAYQSPDCSVCGGEILAGDLRHGDDDSICSGCWPSDRQPEPEQPA